MEVVLEDNGLKEFFDQDIPNPIAPDAQNLFKWKKCVVKGMQIILEGVLYQIVSGLHGKGTPYDMWKELTDLYENNSDQWKLALKDKFRKIKMDKGETSKIIDKVHSIL